MTVNIEVVPELLIQRLRQEIADLKAEIRQAAPDILKSCLALQLGCRHSSRSRGPILWLLHVQDRLLRGDPEEHSSLSEEECSKLQAIVDAYVNDASAEPTIPISGDMRTIRSVCRSTYSTAFRK